MGAEKAKFRIRMAAAVLLAVFLVVTANLQFKWGLVGSYDKVVAICVCLLCGLWLYTLATRTKSRAAAKEHEDSQDGPRAEASPWFRWVLISGIGVGFLLFEVLPRYQRGEDIASAPWPVLGVAVAVLLFATRRQS